ncbi:DNA mismatch repair protein MutL, partial [Escherichia coli]
AGHRVAHRAPADAMAMFRPEPSGGGAELSSLFGGQGQAAVTPGGAPLAGGSVVRDQRPTFFAPPPQARAEPATAPLPDT